VSSKTTSGHYLLLFVLRWHWQLGLFGILPDRNGHYPLFIYSPLFWFQTSTNFFLVKTEILDIVRKFNDMDIQILDLSDQLAPGFIRVSIGTREENDAFIKGYLKIRETFSGAC